MPMPTTDMVVTAVPTATATVMVDTGTARGPLMRVQMSPRFPPAPALMLMLMPTSMVPTPTPMALMVPTPMLMALTPTLMELTPLPMVPTTTARGPLMPTLTTDMVDTAAPTA